MPLSNVDPGNLKEQLRTATTTVSRLTSCKLNDYKQTDELSTHMHLRRRNAVELIGYHNFCNLGSEQTSVKDAASATV